MLGPCAGRDGEVQRALLASVASDSEVVRFLSRPALFGLSLAALQDESLAALGGEDEHVLALLREYLQGTRPP
jgi:hypothetical protein